MRRSILITSSLLVVGLVLTIAMTGLAAGRPMIVCPLNQQAAPRIVPCCPVPIGAATARADIQPICCLPSNCCTGTPCCATACCTTSCCAGGTCASGLTITSTPNPSTAASKVVISGRMLGNPTAGATVTLWQEMPGQSSFHQVAQTKLDSAGAYAFSFGRGKVSSDRRWYVAAQGLKSATMDQLVAAVVGLTPSSSSTRAGTSIKLHGNVSPSHAGETLLIEQRAGNRWVVMARPRLSHTSTYSISHRFARAGKAVLRAVLRADSRNQMSMSRTVTITVRP